MTKRRSAKSEVPELPARILVAIDCPCCITRKPFGDRIAQALDAVLMDTGQLLLSFTKSCLNAGIDLENKDAVAEFCGSATVEVKVHWENALFGEAEASVNGEFFNHEELAGVSEAKWKIAYCKPLREQLRGAVLKLAEHGHVVVLGQGIVADMFPETPFKFQLDAPAAPTDFGYGLRKTREKCFYFNHGNICDPIQYMDVLFVPINSMSLERACKRILSEMGIQYRLYLEKRG